MNRGGQTDRIHQIDEGVSLRSARLLEIKLRLRELLLRLKDETGRIVAPNDFIAAAERYGITPAIDRWVIENAFRWLVSEADERQIGAELEDARPKLEITRKRIIGRGRSYYRLVRAGLLPAGGGFDALVDHAAHVERTRRALTRDVAAEGVLVKRIAELENKLSRVREGRGPLEVQREALHRARAALQEAEDHLGVGHVHLAAVGLHVGEPAAGQLGGRPIGRLRRGGAGRRPAELDEIAHGGCITRTCAGREPPPPFSWSSSWSWPGRVSRVPTPPGSTAASSCPVAKWPSISASGSGTSPTAPPTPSVRSST